MVIRSQTLPGSRLANHDPGYRPRNSFTASVDSDSAPFVLGSATSTLKQGTREESCPFVSQGKGPRKGSEMSEWLVSGAIKTFIDGLLWAPFVAPQNN